MRSLRIQKLIRGCHNAQHVVPCMYGFNVQNYNVPHTGTGTYQRAGAGLTAPRGSRSSAPPARTAPGRRLPPRRAGPSCRPAGREGWARRCPGACGPTRPGSAGRRESTGTWLWTREQHRHRATAGRPLSTSPRGGAAREPPGAERDREEPGGAERLRVEPNRIRARRGPCWGAAESPRRLLGQGGRPGPEGANGDPRCSSALPALGAKLKHGPLAQIFLKLCSVLRGLPFPLGTIPC